MPATIFSGQKIKTLKDTLTLNGKSDIISSTVDPTASAVDAPIGSLLINQTSGKLYRKLDAGSSVNWEEVGAGVGGINYILNPSAEVNTTGWATYADAAGTAPVDGTGGSPNVTWTRSTTSPLRGVADFNFAKDAANRQGQGVSYDFTIDEADKAKVLSVTFDYEVLSGTYADGDLAVYLIADPTGTPVVIQPAGYTVQSATVGTTMRQSATFQTQATGTSYRLCFHVASTSASAYTLAIDNVVVGPQQTVQGAAISDWQSYNGSLFYGSTAATNISSQSFKYRRVGDSIELSWRVDFNGPANATGTILIQMPPGMVIDSNKLSNTFSTLSGISYYYNASNGLNYSAFVLPSGTNSTFIQLARTDNTGTANSSWTANSTTPASNTPIGEAIDNSDSISGNAVSIPIQGWSSNTVMSQDTDTRVVAAHTYLNTTQVVGIGGNAIIGSVANTWGTSNSYGYFDTHSGINFSTGQYLVSVSGFYEITAYLATTAAAVASNAVFLNLHKNGTSISRLIGMDTSSLQYSGSTVVPLSAGDLIDIRLSNGSGSAVTIYGAAADAGSTHWSIRRLSGPATIAASETVGFKATVTTTSVANLATQLMVFSSVVYSTHGAYNSSTGVFTAPVSGKYQVNAAVALQFGTENSALGVTIYKNNLLQASTGPVKHTITQDGIIGGTISDIIQLNAGDTLDIRVYQTNASSALRVPYNAASYINYFSVMRVGN